MFNSLKLFYMSLSFCLDSFCFPVFLKYSFFSHLWLFLFSFFNTFSYLFFIDLIKMIKVYRFLFVNVYFVLCVFVVIWVFTQRTFQLFYVLVRFENDLKIAFQIENMFLCGTINLWKNIRINILKDVFCSSKDFFANPCSYFHLPLKNQ